MDLAEAELPAGALRLHMRDCQDAWFSRETQRSCTTDDESVGNEKCYQSVKHTVAGTISISPWPQKTAYDSTNPNGFVLSEADILYVVHVAKGNDEEDAWSAGGPVQPDLRCPSAKAPATCRTSPTHTQPTAWH